MMSNYEIHPCLVVLSHTDRSKCKDYHFDKEKPNGTKGNFYTNVTPSPLKCKTRQTKAKRNIASMQENENSSDIPPRMPSKRKKLTKLYDDDDSSEDEFLSKLVASKSLPQEDSEQDQDSTSNISSNNIINQKNTLIKSSTLDETDKDDSHDSTLNKVKNSLEEVNETKKSRFKSSNETMRKEKNNEANGKLHTRVTPSPLKCKARQTKEKRNNIASREENENSSDIPPRMLTKRKKLTKLFDDDDSSEDELLSKLVASKSLFQDDSEHQDSTFNISFNKIISQKDTFKKSGEICKEDSHDNTFNKGKKLFEEVNETKKQNFETSDRTMKIKNDEMIGEKCLLGDTMHKLTEEELASSSSENEKLTSKSPLYNKKRGKPKENDRHLEDPGTFKQTSSGSQSESSLVENKESSGDDSGTLTNRKRIRRYKRIKTNKNTKNTSETSRNSFRPSFLRKLKKGTSQKSIYKDDSSSEDFQSVTPHKKTTLKDDFRKKLNVLEYSSDDADEQFNALTKKHSLGTKREKQIENGKEKLSQTCKTLKVELIRLSNDIIEQYQSQPIKSLPELDTPFGNLFSKTSKTDKISNSNLIEHTDKNILDNITSKENYSLVQSDSTAKARCWESNTTSLFDDSSDDELGQTLISTKCNLLLNLDEGSKCSSSEFLPMRAPSPVKNQGINDVKIALKKLDCNILKNDSLKISQCSNASNSLYL